MEKHYLSGRKILIQRVEPLGFVWRKRFPRMKKLVYRPEESVVIPSEITNQQELTEFLYNLVGPGTFQLLAWRHYPLRRRDKETRKIISKDKMFPFFKICKCVITDEKHGKFFDSRLKRTFRWWNDEKYFEG